MANVDNINSRYYDDYNPEKGYYKILYRPSYAVQARELNQQQTMLQEQIGRFGDHVFKEGTIALGGSFDIQTKVDFVKISKDDEALISTYVNKEAYGRVSGVKAQIVQSFHLDGSNDIVLFVRYKDSNGDQTKFVEGDELEIDEGKILNVLDSPDSIGKGSFFSIDEGVLYFKSYFINFDSQSILLSLDDNPSISVSFEAKFSTVSANEDESLYDNAQGSPNFKAPGADRLSAELFLNTLKPEEDIPEDNAKLLELFDGELKESKERTEYNRIYSELAKRTHDESGDYVVHGMKAFTREHLDTGTNEGRFTEEEGGDSNLLSVGIEPGLSYVKGNEIRKRITEYVTINKAQTYKKVNNQIRYAKSGNYILLDEVTGMFDVDLGDNIDLYDEAEKRHTNSVSYDTSPTSTKIGTAKVKSVVPNDDLTIMLFVMDIKMDSGYNNNDVKSVYTGNAFGDAVYTPELQLLHDPLSENLLFDVGSEHTRTIRGENGSTDTSYSYSQSSDVTIDGSGLFSVSAPSGKTFPYGKGSLQTIAKKSFIVVVDTTVDIDMSGQIKCSGKNVTGKNTSFLTTVNVGERLRANNENVIVKSIQSDTKLKAVEDHSFSNSSFTKRFQKGDRIDMSGYGSNGTQRSIDSTTSSLSFNTEEPFSSSKAGKVTYRVSRNVSQEASKTLKSNRFVKIKASSLSSTDKIGLGFSDVLNIHQIRMSSSEIKSDQEGQLATNQFRFNNGQKDSFYDHAYLIPKFPMDGDEYLLVELDYFEPSFSNGYGFFSVDSYPINDEIESNTTIFTHQIPKFKSPSSGSTYNLRDTLDFRSVKQNTATDATKVKSASTNPSSTDTFSKPASSDGVPLPGTEVTFDYSFYLGRKDIATLNTEGEYSVISGEPSENPKFPAVSDNVMGVAELYIAPFPSLASRYARLLGKGSRGCKSNQITNRRYTMKDIGKLDSRITTLEYYNALSLLEKGAVDMEVKDENGLDRFKNGVFVDGFLDHSLGAQYNPDYSITVDEDEQVLRPKFEMDAFKSKVENLEGLQETGNLVTLPYDEKILLEQTRVTTYRNIEQSVFRFIGNMALQPNKDMWVDETTTDKTIDIGEGEEGDTEMETKWNSWEKHGSGYNVYDRAVGDRSGSTKGEIIGSYDTYAEALKRANSYGDGRSVIETVEKEDSRTGIKITGTSEKITEEIGNFVTDVSLTPYIRPQTITVFCKGLKSKTRFHVFFDGENMNNFCTLYDIPEDGNVDNATKSGNEGGNLKSDAYGEILVRLRLPSSGKRFSVGAKDIKITDSPTNAKDATSYSEDTFHAQGLKVDKQDTILSTTFVNKEYEEVSQSRGRDKRTTEVIGPSCMAYSFLVEVPEEEEGTFLTSADVFIQSLHPTLGVWFEIREMSNSGTITRNQVPYSEVWMKRDDPRLKTSDDASKATNINFESPVFLYNDTQYAFIIHTEGLNPDTYFFVSRLGEEDINSKKQVTSRKLTGTVYTTNNNLNWDQVPDLDLTIRFNRADFTGSIGNVTLGNDDLEFVKLTELPGNFFNEGDYVYGSEYVRLSGNNIGDIKEDYHVKGDSSGVTAKVISIESNIFYLDSFGFRSNENVTVVDKLSSPNKQIDAKITRLNAGKGNIRKIDTKHGRFSMYNSNGMFFVGSTIRNEDNDVTYTIEEFDNYNYSLVRYNAGAIGFKDTEMNSEFRGIKASNYIETDYQGIQQKENSQLSDVMTVRSKSESGEASYNIRTTLESHSTYVSPVIDTDVTNTIFVHNIINNDYEGEDSQSGGNLINKYISKIVTLAEGQDAQDLKLFLTAYRPPGSNVLVWAKLRNRNDPDEIDEREWFLLDSSNGQFSSSSDQQDFVEIEYSIPNDILSGPEGEYQYKVEGERPFNGFAQFDIKIGLLGDKHGVLVPRVGNLRTIAMQM